MYTRRHLEHSISESHRYTIRQVIIGTVIIIDVTLNNPNKGNNKITELEQSYKGKVKTHNYINRQNQSTTGKL